MWGDLVNHKGAAIEICQRWLQKEQWAQRRFLQALSQKQKSDWREEQSLATMLKMKPRTSIWLIKGDYRYTQEKKWVTIGPCCAYSTWVTSDLNHNGLFVRGRRICCNKGMVNVNWDNFKREEQVEKPGWRKLFAYMEWKLFTTCFLQVISLHLNRLQGPQSWPTALPAQPNQP